jgi:HK97 family phage major capsid protein
LAARHSSAGGFDHAGAFYAAVRAAGTRGGESDGRLMAAAASTYGNESSGTDGGFAIPPDFRSSIMAKAMNESSLLARCFQISVAGNSLTVPTSMTVPWDTTNGIQATWEGEAAAISQSKPSLQQINIRLHKLGCVVPVSEELLDDSPAMAGLVNREAAAKIDFAISNAIVRGTGAGQPLGYLNAPCLVTQTAETSQVADTIVAGNVARMWARMPVASRMSAIWLVHPDADPQLHLMSLGDRPVYLPPGGFSASPFGMLMGRPVIPHQTCETLGDLGDIMLVDLNQYLCAVKAGGVKAQTSIHVWFDQDLKAFKFTVRIAGQPWWSEVTTSRDGSFTQSPFVTLAARG